MTSSNQQLKLSYCCKSQSLNSGNEAIPPWILLSVAQCGQIEGFEDITFVVEEYRTWIVTVRFRPELEENRFRGKLKIGKWGVTVRSRPALKVWLCRSIIWSEEINRYHHGPSSLLQHFITLPVWKTDVRKQNATSLAFPCKEKENIPGYQEVKYCKWLQHTEAFHRFVSLFAEWIMHTAGLWERWNVIES